jgi:hypothetical protein
LLARPKPNGRAGRGLTLGMAQYGASPVDEEGAQVGVPALGEPHQPLLAPTAVLPWREPKARGHLPAVVELLAIVDRGGESCGDQRADAGQLSELRAALVRGTGGFYPCIVVCDPLY